MIRNGEERNMVGFMELGRYWVERSMGGGIFLCSVVLDLCGAAVEMLPLGLNQ